MKKKVAVIIGAGPAGLTAAYELLEKTDIQPIVFEISDQVGGLSKTVNYKGNRIDIGGHRFFSKSEQVNLWWQKFLNLQTAPAKDDILLNRKMVYETSNISADPEKYDNVMLIRSRLSRIFFLRKFFDYPVSLTLLTIKNLGFLRTFKIGFSYIKSRLFPIKNEKSLEDFFINRFGKELYLTFFKDYTEKVWGLECNQISCAWGAQRIKGLSISSALLHALKSLIPKKNVDQNNIETTLIGQFKYPKFGPGQMWEEVASKINQNGGRIHLNHEIVGVRHKADKIISVIVSNTQTQEEFEIAADYFFSSMPVKDLIAAFDKTINHEVKGVARGLCYRDFITVGLLLKKLKIKNSTKIKTINQIIPDNWIYIQERDVKVGRVQIFNNWSPYMVKDLNNVWIGLEYFCNEGDDLWGKPDKKFISFATEEMFKMGFIEKSDVLDAVIIRSPKAYPAYFGTYNQFSLIKDFTDKFQNLFLIGRNGMHRYNNMDHSMLSAMSAVQNIIDDVKTKDNIWFVNAEKEYHEEKR